MSIRGRASYRASHGRGGIPRGSLPGSLRDDPSSSGGVKLPGDSLETPSGDLLDVIDAADILLPGGPIHMSNFRTVASYNWVDSREPIILVPGSPPVWSPPLHGRRLAPDKGEVFIDQNGARYSSYPLEPMFRAMYELNPELDLEQVDIVICRNTMAKLFEFVTMKPKTFEIDVEIIGDKAVFIRREEKTTEFINDFRGFGHTFPEEYTTWSSDVKGSSSHHRIVEYDLAGLKYLLRYESDGYIAGNAEEVKKESSRRQAGTADSVDTASLLMSRDMLTVGERQPSAGHKLIVRKGGSQIDHGSEIEIKTRAAHKVLDMETVLPRLWMSQTSNLIAAYHKGGRFDDVKVLDVRKDVERWEQQNSMNLQKLNVVILRIVDTVSHTTSMKARLQRTESGVLEIRVLDVGHPSSLPDDLYLKLRQMSKEGKTGQDSPTRDSGEDYDDFEYYHDSKDDDEDEVENESDKDYTACSADDCGYCGHCRY